MKGYNSMLQTVREIAKEDNRMYFLDLANPLHFACVAEQFGGQEHIMREYPLFWKLMDHTRRRCQEGGVLMGARKMGDLQEMLYPCDMHITRDGKVFGAGRISLTQKASQLAVTATLYQGDEYIGHNSAVAFSESSLKVECTSDSAWKGGEATLVLHFAMQRSDEDVLTAAVVTCTDRELNQDLIQSVKVIHPSTSNNFFPPKPVTKEQKPLGKMAEEYVNVCYDRSPEGNEKCHYYYPYGLSNGKQEIYLDVRADVTLKKQGGQRLAFDRADQAVLFIDTENCGIAMAAPLSDIGKYICKTDDGFHLEFPTDWKAVIPGGILAARKMSSLSCTIQYYVKGDSQARKLLITSDAAEEEENQHWTRVPRIKLNWGCVSKDTEVLMADGSVRKISMIKRGDLVYGGKTGAPVQVKDVISGHESVLWCVQSEAGKEIYVSDDHPFVTQNGDKRAEELVETDSVRMSDGNFSMMKHRFEEYYGDTVYNLMLEEDDHYFVANGYVIGDQEIQGNVMRQSLEQECKVPEEVKQEIQKMQRQLMKK